MADESTIMEMMEEMETYFKERDRLFQEREEAYRKRYNDLASWEADLKEKKRTLDKSWKDHEAWSKVLDDREEKILLKDEELEKEIEKALS